MRTCCVKNGLVVGVILLFISIAVQPAIATVQQSVDFNDEVKQSLNNSQGEYVSSYIGELYMLVEKEGLTHLHFHRNGSTHASHHYLDADLDELKIELILNYTAEMNYTLKLPFYFAPIFAFGIEIQNITDCEWEYFKLKHHGYFIKTGNFSIVFNVDTSSVESGDKVIIYPIIYYFSIPFTAFPDKTNKSLISFIRLIYHIPILNDLLLSNWLFPIIGNYKYNSFISPPLVLFFE